MDVTSVVELRAGTLRVAVRPDLGACLAGFWRDDLPVLLSVGDPAAMTASRPSASFPLVPYSNRLADCRFAWQGDAYATRPNNGGSPHSIHGVGWLRPWTVLDRSETQLRLQLVHAADADWPFAFVAEQQLELAADHLLMRMSLVNADSRTAPAGLGWHPYVPRRERSRLQADVSHRWASDPQTQLPTHREPHAGIDADVAQLAFDHCFEGWSRAALIQDEQLSLRITSSEPYLVVYTPATKPYFCVEPVSHVNDAIHMADPAAHGLRTLAPGQQMQAWMRLDVSPV